MGVKVETVGHFGGGQAGIFVLYTGGTIGMVEGPDGALVPLDLAGLLKYVPTARELPVGLTVATFDEAIDSATIESPTGWRLPTRSSRTARATTG